MMDLYFTNIHNNTQTIILGGLCSALQLLGGGAKAPPARTVPIPLQQDMIIYSWHFANCS